MTSFELVYDEDNQFIARQSVGSIQEQTLVFSSCLIEYV